VVRGGEGWGGVGRGGLGGLCLGDAGGGCGVLSWQRCGNGH
jgi:hypothetical protein